MQLSKKEVDKFISWLKSKWTGAQKCTICGHTDWIVPDRVFKLQEVQSEFYPEGNSQPVVSVICKNCGHTVYFNAIHVGLLNELGGRNEEK